MKICLIVDDYMPHSIKVAAKMMHELALEFIKKGHSVSVITPDPSINTPSNISYLDGVKIYRFKSGQIKNVSKIKRAINESLLSYIAWKACKDELKEDKHDLIIYYSPSIFFGSLVKKLKNQWNAKSYLILRDIFPQWVIDNGIIKEKSIITKYFKLIEKINYKNANIIGLMSEKNLHWFNKKNSNKYTTQLLYNWAENSPNKEISTYKKDLKLEDKVVYFYGGNMGHAQDMMNLVRLAKKMSKYNKAHFLFVGAGDEVSIIKESIKKDNLKNITILDSVNQIEFKKLLSEIDIGLFTLNANHKTHNFPGKLLGYMCESKPILGSINPGNDLKEVIEKAKAGYITINGEDDIFYNNAVKLLNTEEANQTGKNGNELLNLVFSVESTCNKILKTIRN